ncbi:protein encore isoform X1 [Eupeodes corollae]|uniref:protein encore isoform X1 n=1 Tax=Eupeodes corollae TaxID=290404 RepID=UPI002492B65B|nr:protein encore isoform X1 [Eupeodes corollae]
MSSVQTQIAVTPNVHNLATSQIQKDYSEDSLNRQNSFGNSRSRGNMKGKHLTRSHAMRESTSPPRTPTPRTDHQLTSTNCGLASSSSSSSSSSTSSTHSPSQETNDCKMHVQSSTLLSPTPLLETPSVIVTSQHSQQQQQQQQQSVICNEADFPKLSPPKSSKSPRNSQSGNTNPNSGNSNNNNNNNNNNQNNNNTNRDLMDKFNNAHQQQCSTAPSAGSEHTNKIEFGNGNGKKVVLEITKTVDTGGGGNGSGGNCVASNSNSCNIEYMNNQTENSGNGSHYIHPDSRGIPQDGAISFYDKENRCPRNDSQNSNNSLSPDENQNSLTDSPSDISKHERMGKKHRTNSNSKSSKPRLKNMGSSSSMDGGNSNSTSGFISRDNLKITDSSMEQFTDQSGVDLVLFFKETLNKNPKDRNTLMKIEKDLIELAQDKTRHEMRFPAASSYNRMLIHRTAAFFGMEHNVDTATQQCVIVATTKGTRLPDIRFKSLFRERMSDEPRKSILKRDTHSFDDSRQSYLCPDRGTLDRKAKSFEEREEEYEKVRRRIFRNRENGEMMEEPYWNWSENSEQASRMRQSNKMLKVQSPQSNDMRNDGRPSVSKSHSFGGYGGPPPNNNNGNSGAPLLRGDSVNSTKSSGPRMFSKQDSIGSTSTPWRLSPSSSGYKTQTQSLRSDSVTPSPTGYGSDEHTPEPSVVHSPPPAPCGLVWAVTDIASVPRGSVLINPHTLQPIVNQDGSIYHFDPSNLPPSQAMASGVYSKSPLGVNMKKKQTDKHKLVSKMDNSSSSGNDLVSSSSSNGGGGGTSGEVVNNTIAESSTETVSESSTQTVVLAAISRDEENDSKDSSITKREMDDIQEETTGVSGEDCEKSAVTVTAKVFDRIEVQKFKHQATSPNIPSPDPEGPVQSNEIVPQNEPKIEVRAQPIQQPTTAELSNSSSSTPASTNDSKKDEPKNWSYTQSYQAIDGSTVFQTANTNPYSTTTYQQGPDGSVYAVPQGMVYTYPPPMDNEMQGYFMPVFDPSQQRDPNSLLPPGSQTIYQPTGGAAMLPVAAYPTTQFTGAPIYPGQVVYSSDQFAASGAAVAAAASGQMQQYPMTTTYPIGYPYPYNGYWGQTMTYYVPQQSLANAVPSSIIPQPTAPLQISNGVSTSLATTVSQVNASNHSSAPNNNNSHTVSGGGGGGGGRGKRATPPHHQQNSVQGNSHSVTSANATYQLGPGVPLALASEINGPTMYAIPQHAVFSSNMLPYTHQSTTTPANAAAATGVLTPLPHQPNAVISSLFNHPPLTSSNGPIPVEPPQPTSYSVHANVSSNHAAANTGTAQSAPSTPHSLSHHNQRNPPLFATPPILSSNYNSPIQNHYQSFTDAQHTGGNSSHTYEKRNSNGVGGMNKNKSSNNGGYSSNGRQNSSSSLYGTPNSNINNKPPAASNDISNQSMMPSNGIQGQRPMHMGQSKRINGADKSQNSLLNSPHMGINGGRSDSNHNGNSSSNQSTQNGSESKPRVSSGYRQKPSNLEFRRSVSQRNSPSANSNESNNNSPNSIVSGYTTSGGGGIPSYVATAADNQQSSPVYITRGAHIPPMHAAAQNAQAAAVVAAAAAANEATAAGCHQPIIGAYNHPGAPAGVYIKYGQTYFAHPTVALQNNRRSPPSDLRPQMAPITGMYPAMNMMISAPRQVQPRHPNPNYKGSRPSR